MAQARGATAEMGQRQGQGQRHEQDSAGTLEVEPIDAEGFSLFTGYNADGFNRSGRPYFAGLEIKAAAMRGEVHVQTMSTLEERLRRYVHVGGDRALSAVASRLFNARRGYSDSLNHTYRFRRPLGPRKV